MADSIAIISGGLDSVTLLHYLCKQLNKRPMVLTFIYGQKHNKEVRLAKYQADLLGCQDQELIDMAFMTSAFRYSALVANEIDIPDVATVIGNPQPPTYVANRNMIFLAIGAAYAEGQNVNQVFYGAQRHDMYGYWDTTPQFLQCINAVLSLNRKSQISIEAPFVNYSKADILRIGLELGVDYSKTWSCYSGKDVACGTCPTCAERLKAFEEVGISDPISYS